MRGRRRCGPAPAAGATPSGVGAAGATVLWEHFHGAFGHRTEDYRPLVRWADTIDAARYASVEEALFGEAPVPLGEIFEALGGGGHSRIGTVRLLGDGAANAPALLRRVLGEIRDRERSPRGGVSGEGEGRILAVAPGRGGLSERGRPLRRLR